MADPAPTPSADDSDPSPQIQQNLKGNNNQNIGEMKGGTAIGKIVGNGTARVIAAGSLVAVVVSSGLGLMAWKQTQQAQLNLADALGASALSLVEQGKDLDAFIPAMSIFPVMVLGLRLPEIRSRLPENSPSNRQRRSHQKA